MRPHGVAVHKRNGQMILSFLSTVIRRVVARDGFAVCPDCSSRITTCSDTVLEAVTNFEPSVTVMRACRSSPPMKGASGVAQFAVCRSYIVRRCRTADAKLAFESPNFETILVRIAHCHWLLGLTWYWWSARQSVGHRPASVPRPLA